MKTIKNLNTAQNNNDQDFYGNREALQLITNRNNKMSKQKVA